jgi:uncharacterized protein (DUF58 family)
LREAHVGFSLAALGRSRGFAQPRGGAAEPRTGAYVTIDDLTALEPAARQFNFLPRQPVHSLLSGRHGSRVRGRGLDFEELRPYLPGDDIRTMDWRVTARTGKPHVRVYSEEKDRPSLFLVDQRTNMFFGTRRAMKSVAAAEAAALGAWSVLAQGDRVGGFVFNDERIDDVRPQRSRGAVTRLLEAVAGQNAALGADARMPRAPGQLDAALEAAARVTTHDALVVIASDFDGHGPRTRDLLLRLALHNDVVAVLVYDPFLLQLPQSGELVVTDGNLQVELKAGSTAVRKSVTEFAKGYGDAVLAWRQEIGIPVLPLSAAEDTAAQIRRFLGGGRDA